jgi:iron(III) transport system permease protein
MSKIVSSFRSKASMPFILWIPVLIVFISLALPLFYLVFRSLGVGAELWELLFRSRTLMIVLRTFLLVVSVTVSSVALGVLLGWLTVRTDLHWKSVWSICFVVPLCIPSFVGAFVFVTLFSPKGILQNLLEGFGVDRLPGFVYGFPGSYAVLVLLTFPYAFLLIRSGIRGIDSSFEETSRALGIGSWKTFFMVTLPLLRPSLVSSSLVISLYTLSDFGAVSVLGYETFTWAIFLQYESLLGADLAASFSLVLTVFAIGIVLSVYRREFTDHYHRTAPGFRHQLSDRKLNDWQWCAQGICGFMVLGSSILMVAVLFSWLLKGISYTNFDLMSFGLVANSVLVSLLAATIITSLALAIAVVVIRYKGNFARLLDIMAYVGFALPGISVALALTFGFSQFLRPLHQSFLVLFMGYLIIFIAPVLGSIKASLLQISPALEEAARSLGLNRTKVIWSVTIPLTAPALVSGFATVFLLCIKELPVTLILSPIGFKTLATSSWMAATEAYMAEAALAALWMIGLASIPVVVLLWIDKRYAPG